MHFLQVYFLSCSFLYSSVWGIQDETPHLFAIKLPPINTENITGIDYEIFKSWHKSLLSELKNTIIERTRSFLQLDFYKENHKLGNENPINIDVQGKTPASTPTNDKYNEILHDSGITVVPDIEPVNNKDPDITLNLNTNTHIKQLRKDYYIFIIFSESPWLFKPENVENLDTSSQKPISEDIPFFAGQTGGHFYPQIIPPGNPWPAKPQIPFLGDKFQESTTVRVTTDAATTTAANTPTRPKPNRPSFAGQTGGNYHPQIIPPGQPLPDHPVNIPSFEDKFKESTTTATATVLTPVGDIPTRPKPVRPSFAGQTGGNYYPQIILPGQPLPDHPVNIPFLGDKYKEPTTAETTITTTATVLTPVGDILTRPKPIRPSFAGQTGGNYHPQIIPSGQPLPDHPVHIPFLEDKFKETTTANTTTTATTQVLSPVGEIPSRPKPVRPSFAGQTGGNYYPQIIPPGQLFPEKPINIPFLEDKFQEPTTELTTTSSATAESVPTRPKPNRPPFAGQTGGNYNPQNIPPGKPLPCKPDNIPLEDRFKETTTSSTVEFRPTTPKPNRPSFAGQSGGMLPLYPRPETPLKPSLEDRFKETTTTRRTTVVESDPNRPQPNRPPFAGQTGGNYNYQLIPPGKPWPARPEDYAEFSVTSKPPFLVDRFKETTTVSNSDRPFFAGSSGGNFNYQLIPPGKPWPAKLEDYERYSITSKSSSLTDSFEQTNSTSEINSSKPNSDSHFFVGQNGGNYEGQLIPLVTSTKLVAETTSREPRTPVSNYQTGENYELKQPLLEYKDQEATSNLE